eukprot:3441337-Pyramimonas_sp.AAC.2
MTLFSKVFTGVAVGAAVGERVEVGANVTPASQMLKPRSTVLPSLLQVMVAFGSTTRPSGLRGVQSPASEHVDVLALLVAPAEQPLKLVPPMVRRSHVLSVRKLSNQRLAHLRNKVRM